MKKQLLFIHGGMAFSKYDAFLEYLRTCEVRDPFAEALKLWTRTLADDLGDEYEVFMPTMPNKQNARYEEWKIWFERYFQFLHDGVILMGHSQGGYFLLKYLSENTMPVTVRAVYLLASPAGPDDFGGEDGGDFNFDETKVGEITKKADKVYIFHSKDDPFVPYSHAERLKHLLPDADLVMFTDKGHFLKESFVELIKHVQGIDV